jgi:NAD(P)H dehydrogenase (quinone)
VIVVSAATGEFGCLVVEHLLKRVPATDLAVAVRNPGKAHELAARGVEVRHGDYDQPDTLRLAFDGADRLLFISSSEVESGKRIAQHRSVVAAARDAGVGMLAYTSGLGADVIDVGLLGDHHATEHAILESGVRYTILRHPIYSDFFINAGLRAAVAAGELTSSVDDRGLNTATRADLAEAAANVLTGAPPASRAYDFTGRRWTYPQLAEVLGAASGRTVTYRDVDGDEGIMVMFGPIIRSGGFEVQTGDLESVLGRPATSLEDAVAAVL